MLVCERGHKLRNAMAVAGSLSTVHFLKEFCVPAEADTLWNWLLETAPGEDQVAVASNTSDTVIP